MVDCDNKRTIKYLSYTLRRENGYYSGNFDKK